MANIYVDLLLDDTAPIYEYSVSLEGNSYIIEIVYNERSQLYFMSLYDADRNPIVLGAGLVPGYPIMYDYALPNLTGWQVCSFENHTSRRLDSPFLLTVKRRTLPSHSDKCYK